MKTSKSLLALAGALALVAGEARGQAARYTLSIVYDSQNGSNLWVGTAPLAGENGECFFTVGSTVAASAHAFASDGVHTTLIGPLPASPNDPGGPRILDAAHGEALLLVAGADPARLDNVLLRWDGSQLVEVTRATDHFDDDYARITCAAIAPLVEGVAFHVRGLEGSRLLFVDGAGAMTTVWDSEKAQPDEISYVDDVRALACGDLIVWGVRGVPGQPGVGRGAIGRFDIDAGFAFDVLHVNDGSSTDVAVGSRPWNAFEIGGIVHLGGSPTPSPEGTIVRRGIQAPGTSVLHRTTCPQPWLHFSSVASNANGEYCFTGFARDCETQQHFGEAVQVGSDPIADRILGVGDAFEGSTVTSIELSSHGMSDSGSIVFLARLAGFRTLVVRADPAPPIFSFCPEQGFAIVCPCGNQGANGSGCANSSHPQGALLVGTGFARLSHDTFTLSASAMPNSASIFLQGSQAELPGVVFGDGVRCISGALVRLGQKLNSGSSSSFPNVGDSPISVRGAIPASAGVSRAYQCYYRNAASFCTSATFNITNAVSVTWGL